MIFLAELSTIALTLIALAIVFILGTTKPMGRQREHVPLYFFLLIALFLLWKDKIPGEVSLSSFSWLFSRVSVFPEPAGTRMLALVILGGIVFFIRHQYRKTYSFFELAKKFRDQLPWFAMFVVLFFAVGSFLFVDYTRIAEMWVLPVPSSTEDRPPTGLEGVLGTSPAAPPRGRTLQSIGEFSARIIFPMVAGCVAVIALLFTWLRTNAIMEQTKNATKTLENTRKTLENSQKQITSEQFRNAIVHLGNAKQAVVLGGIHALHGLAVQNAEYRQMVLEILCSFIREETSKLVYQNHVRDTLAEEKKNDSLRLAADEPMKSSAIEQFYSSLDYDGTAGYTTSMIVIQTIIDKLFRSEVSREVYQEYEADLSGAYLRGIDFSLSHIPKVKFIKAKLQGVRFTGANLEETIFEGADLSRANLQANLQKTVFRKAILQKANLRGADLKKADLEYAVLPHANLQKAQLQGANLREANLEFADLYQADLWSCNLLRSNLQWANLEETSLQEADLRGANLRGSRMIATNLCGASLEGAWMWGILLYLAEMDENTELLATQLQGALSVDEIYYNTSVKEAARNGTALKTNIAAVKIIANNGVEIQMGPDEKRAWFLKKRADVSDLSPKKVQKLLRGLEILDYH